MLDTNAPWKLSTTRTDVGGEPYVVESTTGVRVDGSGMVTMQIDIVDARTVARHADEPVPYTNAGMFMLVYPFGQPHDGPPTAANGFGRMQPPAHPDDDGADC